MTSEELINTYSNYTDEQLLEVYHNIHNYSNEACEALTQVIKNRGGIESLLLKEQERTAIAQETAKIKNDIRNLNNAEFDIDFLVKSTASEKLGEGQVKEIIEHTINELKTEREDRRIKPRTIIGGLLAAIIAGLLGGILWGLQMIWSGRIFLIFGIGLFLMCYAIIKLFTKQSYKNIAVLLFTIISVIVALVIGAILFSIFGKQ